MSSFLQRRVRRLPDVHEFVVNITAVSIMASDGGDRILSLDNVTCSIVFFDVPRKGDWIKEKQRTLTLTKTRGQSQDDCILEVFDKKHKLQLKQPVVFCGILLYSTQKICKKKLEVRQCLDLLFTQLTAIIVFTEDALKAKDTYGYCSKRSREWFNHVITKCVDLASHPLSCVLLHDCRQVLLSLTGSRFALCSTSEPHKCILHWPLERLLPKIEGDILNVQVEGEGSYKFTSRVDKKWMEDVNGHLREYLHLDHTYLEPVTCTPAPCRGTKDPLYLEVTDEPICEKCRQLYQSYFERDDDDQLDTYSLDLNEYVRMRSSLYKRVISKFVGVDAGYITTCTYKGSNNRQSVPGQDGYISMDGKRADTLKERSDEMSDKLATEDTLSLEVNQRSVPNAYQIDYSLPHDDQQQLERSESVSGEDSNVNLDMLLGTLHDVLYSRPPSKDTLQLPRKVRFQLCIKLYQKSAKTAGTCMEDWQLFADIIGLTCEAVNLISIIVKNHSLPQPAGELVLRHWQYVYNTYGETDNAGSCPYACNKENLIKILEEIGRTDLIELIQNSEGLSP